MSPLRILLVEDTLIAQTLAKTQLIDQGCEVDVAADGIIALEKALANSYDLILIDIGLGDGPDGFEVITQIKKQSVLNKTTPIVALTAHETMDYMDKADEVGMDHYFNKPFTPEDAKVIVEYIKKRKVINQDYPE